MDVRCSDLESTRKLFDKFKPHKVIHLAAMVGGLFHNMANNLDFLVYTKFHMEILQFMIIDFDIDFHFIFIFREKIC